MCVSVIACLTSRQPHALGQDWQLLLATAALRSNYFYSEFKKKLYFFSENKMFLKIETNFFLNLTFYFSRKRNYFFHNSKLFFPENEIIFFPNSKIFLSRIRNYFFFRIPKNIFPEIEITHIFPEIEKYIRKLSGPSTLPYFNDQLQCRHGRAVATRDAVSLCDKG